MSQLPSNWHQLTENEKEILIVKNKIANLEERKARRPLSPAYEEQLTKLKLELQSYGN
jgi:hypothetical protein